MSPPDPQGISGMDATYPRIAVVRWGRRSSLLSIRSPRTPGAHEVYLATSQEGAGRPDHLGHTLAAKTALTSRTSDGLPRRCACRVGR